MQEKNAIIEEDENLENEEIKKEVNSDIQDFFRIFFCKSIHFPKEKISLSLEMIQKRAEGIEKKSEDLSTQISGLDKKILEVREAEEADVADIERKFQDWQKVIDNSVQKNTETVSNMAVALANLNVEEYFLYSQKNRSVKK